MNRLIKIIIALLFISLLAFIIRTLYFKNADVSVDEVINQADKAITDTIEKGEKLIK